MDTGLAPADQKVCWGYWLAGIGKVPDIDDMLELGT